MKRAFFSVLGMVIFAAPSLRAAVEPSTKAMQVVGSNLFVAAAGYGVQVLGLQQMLLVGVFSIKRDRE